VLVARSTTRAVLSRVAPYLWTDKGFLPALRVGRRVRIGRSDFDKLLERSDSGAAAMPQPTTNIWEGEIPPADMP
jgi:excisionase family DNA binding protein